MSERASDFFTKERVALLILSASVTTGLIISNNKAFLLAGIALIVGAFSASKRLLFSIGLLNNPIFVSGLLK